MIVGYISTLEPNSIEEKCRPGKISTMKNIDHEKYRPSKDIDK